MKVDERHQKTQQLWQALSDNINDHLSKISLGDLIEDDKREAMLATDSQAEITGIDAWSTPQRNHTSAA